MYINSGQMIMNQVPSNKNIS